MADPVFSTTLAMFLGVVQNLGLPLSGREKKIMLQRLDEEQTLV